uniref:Uncharacterized protein n=1 Tax=Chromera velia CCMP2878 TaxID=1169474 RepID=A0A0G4G7D2_9ALVE|eukprot:Cvel_20574.t1-p1 / transcript=Cvel_20574.t1 / gene=Cvel_20574 / organism=Chromera_velia_CCMP2878 / gene_product=hypothetical protein / transcript_product=hypothetical protein / location=Cvel_scaffold1858:27090-37735(-) / protein_length=910 / sequence_SO=supercontig / SO=protein_coding / is_pseudo=false
MPRQHRSGLVFGRQSLCCFNLSSEELADYFVSAYLDWLLSKYRQVAGWICGTEGSLLYNHQFIDYRAHEHGRLLLPSCRQASDQEILHRVRCRGFRLCIYLCFFGEECEVGAANGDPACWEAIGDAVADAYWQLILLGRLHRFPWEIDHRRYLFPSPHRQFSLRRCQIPQFDDSLSWKRFAMEIFCRITPEIRCWYAPDVIIPTVENCTPLFERYNSTLSLFLQKTALQRLRRGVQLRRGVGRGISKRLFEDVQFQRSHALLQTYQKRKANLRPAPKEPPARVRRHRAASKPKLDTGGNPEKPPPQESLSKPEIDPDTWEPPQPKETPITREPYIIAKTRGMPGEYMHAGTSRQVVARAMQAVETGFWRPEWKTTGVPEPWIEKASATPDTVPCKSLIEQGKAIFWNSKREDLLRALDDGTLQQKITETETAGAPPGSGSVKKLQEATATLSPDALKTADNLGGTHLSCVLKVLEAPPTPFLEYKPLLAPDKQYATNIQREHPWRHVPAFFQPTMKELMSDPRSPLPETLKLYRKDTGPSALEKIEKRQEQRRTRGVKEHTREIAENPDKVFAFDRDEAEEELKRPESSRAPTNKAKGSNHSSTVGLLQSQALEGKGKETTVGAQGQAWPKQPPSTWLDPSPGGGDFKDRRPNNRLGGCERVIGTIRKLERQLGGVTNATTGAGRPGASAAPSVTDGLSEVGASPDSRAAFKRISPVSPFPAAGFASPLPALSSAHSPAPKGRRSETPSGGGHATPPGYHIGAFHMGQDAFCSPAEKGRRSAAAAASPSTAVPPSLAFGTRITPTVSRLKMLALGLSPPPDSLPPSRGTAKTGGLHGKIKRQHQPFLRHQTPRPFSAYADDRTGRGGRPRTHGGGLGSPVARFVLDASGEEPTRVRFDPAPAVRALSVAM